MKLQKRLLWLGLLLSVVVLRAEPVRKGLPVFAGSNESLKNEVRNSITKALDWLEMKQEKDGFWSTMDQPGLTALPIMAIQGRPDKNGESASVSKGYAWLKTCAKPDGGIYRKELPSYNTSLSLTAFTLGNVAQEKEVIANARKFLIGLQTDTGEPGKLNSPLDGGIGYGIKKDPDLSNMVLALEALYYSKKVLDEKDLSTGPELNWQAAIRFIQNCQNLPSTNNAKWISLDPKDKGGFVYAPGRSMAGGETNAAGRVALRSYGTMSYAGLLSYIYADMKPEDARVKSVTEWVTANYTLEENPGMGKQGLYYYFHTLAKGLNLAGVDSLQTKDGKSVNWREDLALRLIDLQKADGSWENGAGRWFEKDPVLVTSYACIAMEILYRKL